MRDLGALQLLTRDVLGWSKSTLEVLSMQYHRSQATDWFSYACASNLLGNVDLCLKSIDVYLASLDMATWLEDPGNKRILD